MKIKIKTKKELQKMFRLATGNEAEDRPLSFDDFVTHISERLMGNKHEVIEVSSSIEQLSFIEGMPEFFVINDGRHNWVILNQFVKEIIL